jgi:spore coat polysaccharide biosynthesis protein SpsF
MSAILVIQARLDSSRLPGKSLLPLGGKPLIFRVMEALSPLPCSVKVLACPEDCAAAFAPLAAGAGYELLAGPKEDVLARYALGVRRFGAGRVVRATGDNPFVFADAAAALEEEAASLGADYAGYAGLPYGAGTESLAAPALLRAEQEALSPSEREHVSPYLYGRPELFRLHRPLAPLPWQGGGLRLTVDTREDYEKAQILYRALRDLPPEARTRGAEIIAVYKKIFM